MAGVQLGQSSEYKDHYDASLLQAIPRSLSRGQGKLSGFQGFDLWNAYELSWLKPSGIPVVALAEFKFCAKTEFIVESKSFKYYLNSLNQTVFNSTDAVREALVKDLAAIAKGKVEVDIWNVDQLNTVMSLSEIHEGLCVDDLEVVTDCYTPDADLLGFDAAAKSVENERLYSHLLKSNCPVTGQPDWATVWVEYSGQKISPESLLKYVVSFRQYEGFHESCVERIFSDLTEVFSPKKLSVYARYTRRGGLDINPFRTSSNKESAQVPFRRLVRQ